MPAPSVLSSERSATSADVEEETTASPNPKPADSVNRLGKPETCGISTNVPAQIARPSRMSGRRPTRSDVRPITGLERNEVIPWIPNSRPTSPGFNPTETP